MEVTIVEKEETEKEAKEREKARLKNLTNETARMHQLQVETRLTAAAGFSSWDEKR